MAGIKMKFIFFLLLFSITIYPQDTNSPDTNKQKNKEIFIEKELQHLKTETDLKIKNLENKIERDYRELKNENDLREEALSNRMALYITFIITLIGLIGFFANFFGKRAIKERVEKIIKDTIDENAKKRIDEELEQRITDKAVNDIIEERGKDAIDKLIKNLEKEGKKIFENQNERYDTLFNELKMKKDEFEKETTEEDKIKLKEFSDVLSKVKKEEEYSAIDWYLKGNKARDDKDNDNAIEYFNRAIQIDSNYKDAYVNRGNAYLDKNNDKKALADYDRATELDPDYSIAFYNRGVMYHKQKKYEKAIGEYSKVIQQDPSDILAYKNRALVYISMKEFDKAINDYNKCLEIDKDDLSASLSLVEVQIVKNDISSAELFLSNVEIEKDDEKYFAIKYFLQYIIAVLKHNDTKVIEDKLDKLLLQHPEIAWSYEEIEEWLSDCALSEPDKIKIQGMIDLLKKYTV